MKRIGTKNLETSRLILRPFTNFDYEQVFKNYASDKEVTKFLSWEAHENVDITKAYIESIVASYSDLSVYNWAIVLKETNEVIGNISATKLFLNKNQLEIGYVLSKNYRNKGLMSEALRIVISFFIEEVKVNKILVDTDARNLASRKVALNANMTFLNVTEKDGLNCSGVCDTAHYEFLKPHIKTIKNL